MILLAVSGLLFLIVLGVLLYCFFVCFYAPRKQKPDPDTIDLPEGEIYEVFWDSMRQWTLQVRATPHEDFYITSFDGLTLHGRFYEYAPGAPMEIMFHGYRGNAERDLSGGMQRCFQLGRSALIVDQRCSGQSGGNVITFGIKEHRDCLAWVDFAVKHFGPDVKIILTGMSMGASTVLTAAGCNLPENVIGVLADCGFHSAKAIISKSIREMGLPPKLMYPFVKLSARLLGHFDLDEITPEEALKNCRIPVIFFHGEDDDFVPCDMSRRSYEACASRKKLVTIPGAGHGLSYPVAPEQYVSAVREFFGPEASFRQT